MSIAPHKYGLCASMFEKFGYFYFSSFCRMSEAAQLILKSVTSAIETTLNPLASQSDRHDAYLFIEEFKVKFGMFLF